MLIHRKMAECVRCGVNSEEVRLFDAVYLGKIESICERCSVIENIPVIKKPRASQLKEAESGAAVIDRMKKISGIRKTKREDIFFREDKLKELDENPDLEKPEKVKLDLIEHYHWEIMKNRRRKGLSQQQLAHTLGESEVALQMIEKGKLPENADVFIRKLEQFFQVRLRKMSEIEKIRKAGEKEERTILMDSSGRELDFIPEKIEKSDTKPKELFLGKQKKDFFVDNILKEPENFEEVSDKKSDAEHKTSDKIQPFDAEKGKIVHEPVREPSKTREPEQELKPVFKLKPKEDLDLKKVDLRSVRISDLKEIHKKKLEVTRQEQIEEQKKIEERQRILEAFREKERMKVEQKKKEDIMVKKRLEDERRRLIEERKKELMMRREIESRELDRELGGSELLNKNHHKKDLD